jgi:hypothetical protein
VFDIGRFLDLEHGVILRVRNGRVRLAIFAEIVVWATRVHALVSHAPDELTTAVADDTRVSDAKDCMSAGRIYQVRGRVNLDDSMPGMIHGCLLRACIAAVPVRTDDALVSNANDGFRTLITSGGVSNGFLLNVLVRLDS